MTTRLLDKEGAAPYARMPAASTLFRPTPRQHQPSGWPPSCSELAGLRQSTINQQNISAFYFIINALCYKTKNNHIRGKYRIHGATPASQRRAKLAEADTNLCRRRSRFGDTVTMVVKAAAVFGPYANRSKWRVIYDQGSRRVSKVFATREEAEAVVATFARIAVERSAEAHRAGHR